MIKKECKQCEGSGHEDGYCGSCNGSGEGYADGTRCQSCKGSGSEKSMCEQCEGSGVLTMLKWLESQVDSDAVSEVIAEYYETYENDLDAGGNVESSKLAFAEAVLTELKSYFEEKT